MKKLFWELIFVLNILVIGTLWWANSGHLFLSGQNGDIWISLGRISGLFLEYLILVELVMISRIRNIEQSYGFDKLNKFHRTVGYFLGGFIFLHPIFLTIGYSMKNNVSFVNQFVSFVTNWKDVFMALLGTIIIIAVIVVSISIFRKKLRYETWHFIHLFMYVGIGIVFLHQINSGDVQAGLPLFYWFVLNFAVFGGLIIYRFLRPIFLFYKHKFFVDKIVKESENVHSVYISGRKINKFNFESGQYANLIFLQKGMWTNHPFSFSSAPNGEFLRFTIKTAGDFTSSLDTLKVGTRVVIDGPLGIFTEQNSPQTKYLFIAGGIGITPIRALAESIYQKNGDSVLFYGAKKESDVVFKKEMEIFSQKSFFFLSEEKQPNCVYGNINVDFIKSSVPDLRERHIYICGPTRMMESLAKNLVACGVEKEKIHYEKFAY